MTAQAQWTNWPSVGNTNASSWEGIRTNWLQLVAAVDERERAQGDLVGGGTGNTNFVIVADYPSLAGYTNVIGAYEAHGFPGSGINYAFQERTNWSTLLGESKVTYDNVFGYSIKTNRSNSTITLGILGPIGSILSPEWSNGLPRYTASSLESTNWTLFGGAGVSGAVTYWTNRYTNTYLLYTNVTCTNLNRTPYQYTDQAGLHTATSYPYVTQAQQAALDARISALIPQFLMTNKSDGVSFSNWFAQTPRPADFPVWSKAGLFGYLGIGYTNNYLTNSWGIVTNGESYFTRYPLMTNVWQIAEASCTGGAGWVKNNIGTMALKYYETTKPVAIYKLGGTNPFSPCTFSLTGSNIITSNQTFAAVGESLAMTSMTQAVGTLWLNITGITCTNTAANIGDTLTINYTNAHPVFGEAPFSIHAADLDERWKVLSELRWTKTGATAWPDRDPLYPNSPWQIFKENSADATNSWAASKTDAEAGTNQYGSGLFAGDWGTAGRVTIGQALTNGPGEIYEWRAVILWSSNSISYVSPWPTLAPEISIYTTSTSNYDAYGNVADYDMQLDDALYGDTNTYKLYPQAWTNIPGSTNAIWLGGIPEPTNWNWCAEPTTARQWRASGYAVDNYNILKKWDAGTNALIYK